jgi:hypothetical protein
MVCTARGCAGVLGAHCCEGPAPPAVPAGK